MVSVSGSLLKYFLLTSLLLLITHCATKPAPALPSDILGIRIGMDKSDAQKQLEAIADFERDERKRQQVWKVRNDPRFSQLAVGYDENNQIRYVTAFVEPATAKERIKFSDVGDLSKAKAEIVQPHYRYIWEIPSEGGRRPFVVNVYGDNPEFVTTYSLAGKVPSAEEKKAGNN